MSEVKGHDSVKCSPGKFILIWQGENILDIILHKYVSEK